MGTEEPGSGPRPHGGVFATTHWSVVVAAGEENPQQSAAALEQLCRTYWYPLYGYVRRRGYSPEDAQDLTQEFFARFLERESFGLANPARGRFRTFLLKSLQHFLADDWKRVHRAKRGGRAFVLPLDDDMDPHAEELAETVTPERAYEERWALTLLEHVLARMREDYARIGKARVFDALQDLLWGAAASASYSQLAKELAMSEGALRVTVHRLRTDYRERLRAEVANTVSNACEVDSELRYLISMVSGRE